jgi:hypothetical protein
MDHAGENAAPISFPIVVIETRPGKVLPSYRRTTNCLTNFRRPLRQDDLFGATEINWHYFEDVLSVNLGRTHLANWFDGCGHKQERAALEPP